ncbi:MAG: hypothetical protein ABIU63_14915 [Chitinophagaceae bacterium]
MACRQRTKTVSFYYWKTRFRLDSLEKQALFTNGVTRLYTRYFDVDLSPGDSAPHIVAPISFDTSSLPASIVPVVYIKNRVLEQLDSTRTRQLATAIQQQVKDISRSVNISPREIQFDCDWTATTRDNYFMLLRQYKILTGQTISATIRLHQIKYSARTGIPPVDLGVLMYYNMGDINAGSSNSIYEKGIAARYAPSIKIYPLELDIALPIFAWSLQIRDGKVVKLLNKMSFLHFENDTNFTAVTANSYAVKHACFHGGYYFKEQDKIKTEHVTAQSLLDMVAQVNAYSNHRIRNLIFYDLDKENLVLYDEAIFKKIMDRLD